jgi:tetratricopeptide (TPR) repeat protein
MALPDWRTVALNEGVLREPIPESNRIVLWLPGPREGLYQHWERIGNVPQAEIQEKQGICAVAALLIQARQRVRGLFGKLFGRKPEGTGIWILPNGESAEQSGERQTDLMMVWAKEEANDLDATRIKSCWPQSNRCQRLGKNLFLVGGVEQPAPAGEAEQLQGNPHEQAEQLLAAARAAGDRAKEASALTELGILHLRAGDARRALAFLEEAAAVARELGDRALESDVLSNLGMAALTVGQSQRALDLFNQELTYARAAGNRFGEKTLLDSLGFAFSAMRDPAQALIFYGQALALAREVGDRQHEADLLWFQGIQHADLGQREQTIARAQEAIDLLEKMGNPHAKWFADHLQKYRTGDSGAALGGTLPAGPGMPPGVLAGGSIVASSWAGQPGAWSAPEQTGSGPGLLRMAFSAAKSMTKFFGSGLKMVTPQTRQKRLRTCAACEHHTGMRCKICGCFTSAKAWLPHEDCPIGKWP